jgi:hypothetical protein
VKKNWLLGSTVLSVGASAFVWTSTAHAQPADAPPPPAVDAPAPPAPPPPPPPPAATEPVAPEPVPPPPPTVRDYHRERHDIGEHANEDGPVDIQPGPHTEDERDAAPGADLHHEDGPFKMRIEPFAAVVGGAKLDTVLNQSTNHNADSVNAIMLADFGLRGQLTPWATFESEIMANGGTDLQGSSVYEGEAALQVRKQVLHMAKDWWMVEVGRVLDEASVDYLSSHVVDTFLEDTATRDALLFDGLNLGNGVRGTAEILPGLRLGMAANAGNITSSSSLLAFGGAYAPYTRIFYQAAASTRNDTNGYPSSTFGQYVFSPSAMFARQLHKQFGIEAHTELQYFLVDPNTLNDSTKFLRGYNYRGNVAAHILKNNVIQPFFNVSYGENNMVEPNNATKISPDKYKAVGIGGGLDINYQKKFGQYNGVGFSVMEDESKQGTATVAKYQYWNVGTTYWLSHNIALGARFSIWHYNQAAEQSAGDRSLLVTARFVL